MSRRTSEARRCSAWQIAALVVALVILLLTISQLRPHTDPSAPLFPFVDIPRHKSGSLAGAQDNAEAGAAIATGASAQGITEKTKVGRFELFAGLLIEFHRRELVSLSTKSGNYSPINFSGRNAYNPNLIPHPEYSDTFLLVAQKGGTHGEQEEIICEASFKDDVLVCSEYPALLPIAPSIKGNCPDQFAALNDFPGPRDARLAYSPRVPYIVYGSQPHYACLGLWTQDLRKLVTAFDQVDQSGTVWYQTATELWRPEPYDVLQKNFFMFWDSKNRTHVQSDAYPKRVLAQLDADGHVVADLSPAVEAHDQLCMSKYMPVPKKAESILDHESIHQSTNSLSITLCNRADPNCHPDESNTFIMHIIHHKFTYSWHTVYEPYIVLFQRDAPFGLHAISKKSFWIRGRALPQTKTRKYGDTNHDIPAGQSEMFYVTSMSWKHQNQTYHGYMDDPVFLALGIEDAKGGVVDVLAGDLVQDLGFC